MKSKIKKFVIESVGIIIGSIVIAFGIDTFLLPNQLSTGGFSGISTILYYLLKVPMGWTTIILNVPLFIFSAFKIGKSFFMKSVLGTVGLSIFLELFSKIDAFTNDRFLACIYGGVIVGLGTAIILKLGASTGGSELVSRIVKEYNTKVRLGNIITMMDIVIVFFNVVFFKEVEIGLYSAIAIYLMGKIIDIFFEGVYFTKLIFIISNKYEDIAKDIGEKVQKGTTGIYGKGMYTNKDKMILMCAASRRDVLKVKEIAKNIDDKSFIIISNAREVFGKGFKKE